LPDLSGIPSELRRQCQRRLRRKVGLAPIEGGLNGFAETRAVKLEVAGQKPDVIEVFHPAIGDAEHDHRLELLGYDCLPGIGSQYRGRELEHGGVSNDGRARYHGVADADVDLEVNPGLAELCPTPHPDTFVFLVLLDPLSRHGGWVEAQPVLLDGK